MTTYRRSTLLAVLLTGQAMASMDTSIAAVAAPAIRADLAGPPALTQLVLAAYTLAFAVLVVTGARLGTRFGPGRVFLAGLAGFTAASLACGLAPGPVALVLARVVQGAAGALMVPQVLTLVQARFDGAARARAIGAYSMILALGVAAGQIAGGLLVTLDLGGLTWRAAFLVNVPVGVPLLLVGRRVLADAHPAGREPLDPAGVVLLSAAMLILVLPLMLGQDLGWPVWAVLPPAAAGAAGLGLFVRYEERLAARGGAPLLDVAVLRLPGVPSGLLAAAVVMGCYAGFLFSLTLSLQDRLGFTPLAAGLAFVPYATGFALLGRSTPRLPRRLRGALPVAGPLVLAAVVPAVAVLSRGGWPWVAASVLLLAGGAGHAAGFSPLVTRLAAAVPATAAGALSALVSTATLLAAVLGVAVVGGLHLALPPAAPVAATLLLLAGAAAASASRRTLLRRPAPPSRSGAATGPAGPAGPGGPAGPPDPAVARGGADHDRATSRR